MGVITAFLLFTAGGGFVWKSNVTPTENNHFKGKWIPFSVFTNILALTWSFLLLGASLYYTFPVNDTWSDIPAIDGRHGFPTTPWGGYACSLVYLVMTFFFFSYFMEWFSDNNSAGMASVGSTPFSDVKGTIGYVSNPQFDSGTTVLPLVPARFPSGSGSNLWPSRFSSSGASTPIITTPGSSSSGSMLLRPTMPAAFPATFPYDFGKNLVYEGPVGDVPIVGGQAQAAVVNSSYYNRTTTRNLGVRMDSFSYLNTDKAYENYNTFKFLPFTNKAFACACVFADSLLFVGMLNSQNSPLKENVVSIWYYIFLCRAFQFAATFFMDTVLLEQDRKEHQSNIVVACCQLCSLCAFLVVIVHLLVSFELTQQLSTLGFNQTYSIQITFLLAMALLELAKHVLVFKTILWGITPKNYQWYARIIFLADCIIRTIFIYSASLAVSSHLGEQNLLLYTYLKTA
jgi:hypothetical protein